MKYSRRQVRRKASWSILRLLLAASVYVVVIGSVAVALVLTFLMDRSQWPPQNQIGIVFNGEGGYREMVVVQANQSGVVRIKLAPELMVPMVRGYGPYRNSVLERLEELEANPRLIEESLEHWLGVGVVGRVDVDGGLERMSRWRLAQLVLRMRSDDVGVIGRMSVARSMIAASFRSMERVNLVAGYGQKETAAGEEVVVVNQDALERLSLEWLEDEALTDQEDVVVAVINGTDRSGLALAVAEFLGRVGYDVASVNGQPQERETRVIVDEKFKDNEVVLFNLKMMVTDKIEIGEGVQNQYRADVAVILGDDFREFWYGSE